MTHLKTHFWVVSTHHRLGNCDLSKKKHPVFLITFFYSFLGLVNNRDTGDSKQGKFYNPLPAQGKLHPSLNKFE